jgi:hypothetical protein
MPDDRVEQPLARREFLQTHVIHGFVDQYVHPPAELNEVVARVSPEIATDRPA